MTRAAEEPRPVLWAEERVTGKEAKRDGEGDGWGVVEESEEVLWGGEGGAE